jgi:hypothetical protein
MIILFLYFISFLYSQEFQNCLFYVKNLKRNLGEVKKGFIEGFGQWWYERFNTSRQNFTVEIANNTVEANSVVNVISSSLTSSDLLFDLIGGLGIYYMVY